MDGKDFLEVSKRLYKSVYEADRRTSISRAYYGLWLVQSCRLNPSFSICLYVLVYSSHMRHAKRFGLIVDN